MDSNSNEIWRDVVGYEDTHQVSNLGRVRVKERVINTSTGKRKYKSNNIVDNLEWCTVAYNNTYGTRLERVSKTRSKPIIQYSLDDKFIRIWDSTKEAAKFIGCCRENINRCLVGVTKTAYGYKWKYNGGIQIKRNINN